jgi:hypothetical protein
VMVQMLNRFARMRERRIFDFRQKPVPNSHPPKPHD